MSEKLPKKYENFSEWFSTVLSAAEITDFRYPVKGMGIWLPHGFAIRRNVLKIARELHDETGHQEVLFPLLIPESFFQKEAEHIAGFESQVYWVTQGGLSPLDVKLLLRPTSETAIYPMFKLWIRSHADLPVKVYQIVSIFRYETKATKPLIRVREITTFKEAHTAHATIEDLMQELDTAVWIYSSIFDRLLLPYLISKRPDWDKFAGAEYSMAFDTLTPDGRSLQIGTVHNLGQNFAHAFDIQFENEAGSHEYVYQSCFGISERVIAALISIHGDDRGLILPPEVAPFQAVIVPIYYKEKEKEVREASEQVLNKLRKAGLRVQFDDRDDLTPGAKYYYHELRGVPVRIELGPRDVKENKVTLVRRDTLNKEQVSMDSMIERIQQLMDEITENMKTKAERKFKERIFTANNLEEVKEILSSRSGIVEVSWCGEEGCAQEIEEEISGSILGTPVTEKEIAVSECIVCQNPGKVVVRIARAY